MRLLDRVWNLRPRRLSTGWVLFIGFLFHGINMWSIFDIYFVTPLVHGMEQYRPTMPPPAKRLFLVVGDGLRADKLFQTHEDPDTGELRNLAPFLRSKVLNEGRFGVSHTRVPTESRPGHVAIIAGFYEDVSAVTKGWKFNPVDFDSVFNQSRHTWSFGSPDILPMFQAGASDKDRVEVFTYGHEFEDFSQDATMLDKWVFDRVESLFGNATRSPSLNSALRQDKNVFFLHLLGLDTTGHSYRPYSKEYLRNIKVVDAGLEATVKRVNNFYGDENTAWIFTADHGMSDWGSHGDGHPDNTRTPLIAWGKGIARPAPSTPSDDHDEFSADWYLDQVKRVDVRQADIAPLMTYLVGLNYPANSVGEIPLDFLDASQAVKSDAILANAREIAEQYLVKEDIKSNTELFFKPYPALIHVNSQVQRIQELNANEEYSAAIEASEELINSALAGLRYLQRYDWLFLRSLITFGFLAWAFFLTAYALGNVVLSNAPNPQRTYASLGIAILAAFALFGTMWLQRSPWTYYLYAIFPIALGESILTRKETLYRGFKLLDISISTLTGFPLCILFLELMVYSYFERRVFSACFTLLIFWPCLQGVQFLMKNKVLLFAWTTSCAALASFPLFPVIKVESLAEILSAGVIMLFMGLIYVAFLYRHYQLRQYSALDSSLLGIQLGLIAASLIYTYISVTRLQSKIGLGPYLPIVGWILLALSIIVPLTYRFTPSQHYIHRLAVIFLAFSPSFIILTISYEGFFFIAFFVHLMAWVQLECTISSYKSSSLLSTINTNGHSSIFYTQSSRMLKWDDVRIALFYLYFLQVAFFGIGNVASVSSFSLDSVYRLKPVFDPFIQGIVLAFKLMLPFACISANLGVLNRRLRLPPSALFMIVMVASEVLALNFFYLVRDEGSWLDIGTSISHFMICNFLSIFVLILEYVSSIITSDCMGYSSDTIKID